jgi:hypothetical protein
MEFDAGICILQPRRIIPRVEKNERIFEFLSKSS